MSSEDDGHEDGDQLSSPRSEFKELGDGSHLFILLE
jgi:hypothetical protein